MGEAVFLGISEDIRSLALGRTCTSSHTMQICVKQKSTSSYN